MRVFFIFVLFSFPFTSAQAALEKIEIKPTSWNLEIKESGITAYYAGTSCDLGRVDQVLSMIFKAIDTGSWLRIWYDNTDPSCPLSIIRM